MIGSELFISTGVLACFTGTFLSGIIALLSHKVFIQRIAQVIILIAMASGAAAATMFFLNGLPALTVWESNFFPFGKLVIDQLSAIFFFLINGVGVFTILYGVKYILNEKGHYNLAYLQFLTAIFVSGMQLVVLTTTPVFFLFAWEIMSFSSFLLVIADLRVSSIRPAIFYLVMTHLGAGAILAGFLFLSGGTYNIDFTVLNTITAGLPTGTVVAAFLLFLFGFGSKAGLFPLHGWLPEAHPQAPSHISALMSGVMLKIAVYGIIRVILFIMPVLPVELGYLVVAIGLFSAIFGVIYSVVETDIKRILAFSSIENLGLIFSMIGIFMVARSQQMELLANVSLVAALYQSFCHSLFKSGLFLTAGVAGQSFQTRNLEKMGGMAKHMRFFSFASLLLALTAAALPPSGAFIGEWLVINSIITSIYTAIFPVKVVLLLTLITFGLVAGMAVFSQVRYFGIGFLAEPRTRRAAITKDPDGEMLFPVVFLGISAFLVGSVAQPLIGKMAENLTSPGKIQLFNSNMDFFTFSPLLLLALMALIFVFTWLLRKMVSNSSHQRQYHTWDCGQPIDSSMEYTATAFCAPIRFFFSSLLNANKRVSTQPIIESNPLLVKKSVTFGLYPVWDKYLYNPLVNLVNFLSSLLRKLQNGNIQFYITLILISLIITAIISL